MTDRDVIQHAVEAVLVAKHWRCDDGHNHKRPEKFTLNRLRMEVNRRHPRNLWSSSEIGCAIWDLIEAGKLKQDKHLRLRIADPYGAHLRKVIEVARHV